MRSILLPGVLVAGLGFLSACGSSSDDAAKPDVTLELATWWTGMSEVNAINALLDVHKTTHPDVKVKTLSAASQSELQDTITNRFTTGNPPAAFQANLGGSALTWGPSAQSLNTSSSKWSSSFDKGVLEQLTADGSLIGVPLALTRQNVAYWNLKVLNTVQGLTTKIPSTLDELDVWLGEVSAKGYTHPLCFGGKDSWVVAHVMFEDIVPARAGATFSKNYWGGKLAADAPEMIDALDYAKKIMPYLSADWIDMDMSAGINKLMSAETDPAAQCLMTSMGDWGGAILAESGANKPAEGADKDGDFFGTGWPAVGGSARVVFGGDTFVAARGAANQQAVFDFFDTMASETGQIAFNKIKGSMPARIIPQDKRDAFSVLTQKNMNDLELGGGLAGFKLIGKAAFPFDKMADVVRDYFQTKDSTTLVTYLKDNYGKLK